MLIAPTCWVCGTINSFIVDTLEDTAPSWPPPIIIIIALLKALFDYTLGRNYLKYHSHLYVAKIPTLRLEDSHPGVVLVSRCLADSSLPLPTIPYALPPRALWTVLVRHSCLTQTSFFSLRPWELCFNKHRSINRCVYQGWIAGEDCAANIIPVSPRLLPALPSQSAAFVSSFLRVHCRAKPHSNVHWPSWLLRTRAETCIWKRFSTCVKSSTWFCRVLQAALGTLPSAWILGKVPGDI